MTPFLAELIGTALLVLMGNGVVANVLLTDTKGHNAGWIAINFGYAMAVFVGVWCTADVSGAHLNPAVTIGLAVAGKFDDGLVVSYIVAQFIGAMLGSTLVFWMYAGHYARTADPDAKLGTFCTAPAIRNPTANLVSETIATFVLVFAVMMAVDPSIAGVEGAASTKIGLGSLGALPVALFVLGIGLSLGGTTGYAINPARDLGPRIAHAILPVPGKRDGDWGYAWIPVVGPTLGGLAAAGAYLGLQRLAQP
jgi:glycerol uptake facilitator protein